MKSTRKNVGGNQSFPVRIFIFAMEPSGILKKCNNRKQGGYVHHLLLKAFGRPFPHLLPREVCKTPQFQEQLNSGSGTPATDPHCLLWLNIFLFVISLFQDKHMQMKEQNGILIILKQERNKYFLAGKLSSFRRKD